jgi:caffeoyl-CoA O-methyltransferase
MSLINDEMQQLLLNYCEPESALLQKIDRETNLKVLMPRMLSGHYQGRVLSMLSKMISPATGSWKSAPLPAMQRFVLPKGSTETGHHLYPGHQRRTGRDGPR